MKEQKTDEEILALFPNLSSEKLQELRDNHPGMLKQLIHQVPESARTPEVMKIVAELLAAQKNNRLLDVEFAYTKNHLIARAIIRRINRSNWSDEDFDNHIDFMEQLGFDEILDIGK